MKNTFKNNHNYTLKQTHTFLLINYHACKEAFLHHIIIAMSIQDFPQVIIEL